MDTGKFGNDIQQALKPFNNKPFQEITNYVPNT